MAQLSYTVTLWVSFREYENLKEARKISGEMTEKLKKELFSVNNKVKGESVSCQGEI